MKTTTKIILLFFLLSSSIQLSAQIKSDTANGEILIQLLPTVQPGEFIKKMAAAGLQELELEPVLHFNPPAFLLKFDTKKTTEAKALSLLQQQQEIISASPNAIIELRGLVPNDSLFDYQWNMDIIHAPEAWDLATGGLTGNGKEIVIAIFDSGFQIDHVDLVNNLWFNKEEIAGNGIDDDGNGFVDDLHGWNFVADTSVMQEDYHGTGVAGIIGATGNNGEGVAGINWSVKMMYFSVSTYLDIVAAQEYMLAMRKLYNRTNGEKGAFIVATNSSLGFSHPCTQFPLWAAIQDSLGKEGVLSVGATINANIDVDEVGDTPTSCPSDYLIAVSNSDKYDRRNEISGYGKKTIDLTAPGGSGTEGVFTTKLNNDYKHSFTSNSAAAPHVTGAVGLLYAVGCEKLDDLIEKSPSEAALVVKKAIMEGTDPLLAFEGLSVTGGRLNLFNSMNYLIDWCHKTGEYDGQKNKVFNLSPVPVDDLLTVELATPQSITYYIQVFNAIGELVHQEKVMPNEFAVVQHQIDVTNFSPGIYFIAIRPLGGELFVRKFVVAR